MKDEIEAEDIRHCPCCGAPCVLSNGLKRYWVPVDPKKVGELAKTNNRALNAKLEALALNLAAFLASKNSETVKK